ncbi:MAG: hypothetical protein FWE40_02860 [Oscillospiraceae bacterium]|nr:hypothetical protein [Oscillospiraceae bacterium]
MKRLLSLLLVLAMLAGLFGLHAAAFAPQDELTWELSPYPVILIHGMMQADVFLYEDDVRVYPHREPFVEFDESALIRQLLFPLLSSLLLQMDLGLSRALHSALLDSAELLHTDEYGRLLHDFRTVRYPVSLAELSQAERDRVYSTLPIRGMAEHMGEENVYFFTYNSFGHHRDIVDELYEFIQFVRDRHGAERVNLVPISLGGTLFNGLIEYFPNVHSQLSNVVLTVGAMDGSNLAGDLYTRNLRFDNVNLYHDLFPEILGDSVMGTLMNIALRFVSKPLLMAILNTAIDTLIGEVLSFHTNFLALVPSAQYAQVRELWLMEESHDEIRAIMDAYHQAQVNAPNNILSIIDQGGRVYVIAEFDYAIALPIGHSYSKNGDGLIPVASAGLGVTAAPFGQTLSAEYIAGVDPRYISPCGVVDMSTALLPDHTWLFKEQNHEATAQVDVIIRLITRLATDAEHVDVFSMPEWPQFNYGRNTRIHYWIQQDLLEILNDPDRNLTAEQRTQLEEAVATADAMFANTHVEPAQTQATYRALHDALVAVGLRQPYVPSAPPSALSRGFGTFMGWVNTFLYFVIGPRGFFDPFWRSWTVNW